MKIQNLIQKVGRFLSGRKRGDQIFEITQFYPASESIAEMARIRRAAKSESQRKFVHL